MARTDSHANERASPSPAKTDPGGRLPTRTWVICDAALDAAQHTPLTRKRGHAGERKEGREGSVAHSMPHPSALRIQIGVYIDQGISNHKHITT